MIKSLLLALVFVLMAGTAFGQTTTVTINAVTDGDGTVWANGSYSIVLTSPPGIPLGPYNLRSGGPVATQSAFGQLNTGGSATGIVLTSNTSIAPAGTVWQFTICPTATSTCFTTQQSITGATQSVSITPPAIRINLAGIPFRVTAYNDVEIVAPTYGNLYYNVTEPSLRVCLGNGNLACVFQDVAAGGGLSCGTPALPGIVLWDGAACLIDTNASSDGNGNFTFQTVTANSLSSTGPGGVVDFKAQTPPVSVPASHFQLFLNTNTGLLACLNNALGNCFGAAQIVAASTATMGTAAITSGSCAATVTVAATGALTTDKMVVTANVDPTGVTGYGPSASGSLYIQAWPTANNVNFKVCNNTAGSITPAALTLNWGVVR